MELSLVNSDLGIATYFFRDCPQKKLSKPIFSYILEITTHTVLLYESEISKPGSNLFYLPDTLILLLTIFITSSRIGASSLIYI